MIQINNLIILLLIFTTNYVISLNTTSLSTNTTDIILTENQLEKFIYICGGFNRTYTFSQCFKYNKHINVWQSIQSMSTVRRLFGLVSLDKKLYAMGGYTNMITNSKISNNSCETYDTQTNTWKSCLPMNLFRSGFGATVIDNTIYVCGGQNDNEILKSCEYYSPNSDEWYFTTPMNVERRSFDLVSHNGFLYAIGGYNDKNGYLNSIEMFDRQTNQWTFKANMLSARAYFGSGSFMDKIYVCGGAGNSSDGKLCETYDPKTNKWQPISSMKTGRESFKLIAFDTSLYALGGYLANDNVYTDSVEIYDYVSDKWFLTTALPQNMCSFGATAIS